ncbi:MAG TPA: hypothetical protein VLT62_08040 [Candidatus Methylomirabilis sp.]|nr:hypothetical protein [Candidatus Methylomirabilis sp.]
MPKANAECLALDRYSMMEDDWQVEKEDTFISPLVKDRPGQTVLFGKRIRNGSISADVTILESLPRRSGGASMEVALMARYGGPEAYYYAGTGAFYAKFFIGKVLAGPVWQARQWIGQPSSVFKNKPYRLRLAFKGSQIALYENDVQQLVVVDDSYQIGQCGLTAWKTRARFENVCIKQNAPKAFVIMPFASELDFVHKVIQTTVEDYGINCVRADQIAISRPVMDDVKAEIAAADLVIVDFTGKNPNVYYEAGLADAWKKDWIVLAQSSEDMTFDVRHIRSIRYTNTMGADANLAKDLGNALVALGYRYREDPWTAGERNDRSSSDQGAGAEEESRAGGRRNPRGDPGGSARRNRKPPAKKA